MDVYSLPAPTQRIEALAQSGCTCANPPQVTNRPTRAAQSECVRRDESRCKMNIPIPRLLLKTSSSCSSTKHPAFSQVRTWSLCISASFSFARRKFQIFSVFRRLTGLKRPDTRVWHAGIALYCPPIPKQAVTYSYADRTLRCAGGRRVRSRCSRNRRWERVPSIRAIQFRSHVCGPGSPDKRGGVPRETSYLRDLNPRNSLGLAQMSTA
jgi:hypothetical protein